MKPNIDEIIEEFYLIFETGLDNYTRPADYKERFLRAIRKRKPMLETKEGRKYEKY